MNKLLLVIIFITKETLSLEPTISIGFCKGEHEYLDKEGRCTECEKCPVGYQPREYCGYGDRHIAYGCEVCPLNSFSTREDYNVCVLCRPCGSWNSETIHECTTESNRVCGNCFDGYFRPVKSDGELDDECHSCAVALEDNRQCHEAHDEMFQWWKFIAVTVSVLLIILILVISLIVYLYKRRRTHHRRSEKSKKKKQEVKVEDSNGTDTRESLLGSRPPPTNRDDSSRDSVSSDSGYKIRVTNESDGSVDTGQDGRIKSQIVSHISETQNVKAEATRYILSHSPAISHHVSDTGYSNMPTAEYIESIPNQTTTPSFSNLPTRPYDDDHPSQVTNQRQSSHTSSNSTHSFRLSSSRRHRPQMEASSSSENLLENVDRDSKLVGGQRTPVDFVAVEFFDTVSIDTDVTKPHKIG